MKYLKNGLVLLLILSIFIVSCKVTEETVLEETPLSTEEEEILNAFEEIDDLESLDEEFDINLDELDDLELE